MKFARSLATTLAVGATAVLAQNTTAAAPQNTTSTSDNSNVPALLGALKAVGHYNILSSALARFPEEAAAIIASDQGLTILAPNDAAFAKIGGNATISKLPKDVLLATIQYHVIQGILNTTTDLSAGNHTAKMTLLNNETYSMLPDDMAQAVILSVTSSGYPMVVETAKNVSFAEKTTNLTTDKFALYGIDDILTVPGNLTSTLAMANLTGLATAVSQRNLTETLNAASGLTIFAPTTAAFTAAQGNLTKTGLTATDVQTILAGHILNGTVAYEQDLLDKATEKMSDAKAKIDDTTYLLGTVTAAAGQSVNITYSTASKKFSLMSGNTTAQIVRTDILYNGGVIHTIDKVLMNTETDAAAASDAAKGNDGVTGAMDGHSDGSDDSSAASPSLKHEPMVLAIASASAAVLAIGMAVVM